MSPDIVVLPAPWRGSGKTLGGLFINITTGYQWLLERYAPDILLRLDVDALMTGPGLADAALDFFSKNPGVGVIGSYRIRTDGEIRDWSWGARRIRTETGLRGMVHPAQRKLMRELVSLARANGYVPGEHALGAGLIHSLAAADNIFARGWNQLPALSTSRLGEDMIMGLLAVAAGYPMADFGRPEDPLALKWRGLPAHPKELLAEGKLIVHSVRYWDDLKEAEIRQIFRDARDGDTAFTQRADQ